MGKKKTGKMPFSYGSDLKRMCEVADKHPRVTQQYMPIQTNQSTTTSERVKICNTNEHFMHLRKLQDGQFGQSTNLRSNR